MKKLVATVYIKDGHFYMDRKCLVEFVSPDGVGAAVYYSNVGMDAVCLLECSDTEQEHNRNLASMKTFVREAEIPVYAGGIVKRFEDVKKYLYTGAEKAVFIPSAETWENALLEASSRFGAEKLIYYLSDLNDSEASDFDSLHHLDERNRTLEEFLLQEYPKVKELVGMFALSSCTFEMWKQIRQMEQVNFFVEYDGETASEALQLLEREEVSFLGGRWIRSFSFDAMAFKRVCKAAGIDVNLVTVKWNWGDLKPNADGLVPVIVQEDRTEKILMLAYMNEEAFCKTIETGRMTYYSRSRRELWVKGLTSGHFQYVKELTADCDFDTLLARVSQVGVACHTGASSCFFHTILDKERRVLTPFKALETEYATIVDRKQNPKEGSYTNYLLEKGLDKILKKVGEEATEIIIAAKNPDSEEIKYELADFLYHAMVMMVECGVSWEDVMREIANR